MGSLDRKYNILNEEMNLRDLEYIWYLELGLEFSIGVEEKRKRRRIRKKTKKTETRYF